MSEPNVEIDLMSNVHQFKASVRKTFKSREAGKYLAITVPHFNDLRLSRQVVDWLFEYCKSRGVRNVQDTVRVAAVQSEYIQAITFIPVDDLSNEKLIGLWDNKPQLNAFCQLLVEQQDSHHQTKH